MTARVLLVFGIISFLGAVAPAAHAGQVTFGSDLTAPASISDEHQADTLFFNQPGQANSLASPVDGEVVAVRVKGTIESVPGRDTNSLFHIQTLHPETDGRYTVTSSTEHLFFPVDVPSDTVSTYRAGSAQCVAKGDVVDFNNVGGWDGGADPRGTIYKIFGRKPGNNVFWFEADNGTNIGTTFAPNRQIQGGSEVRPGAGVHPDPGVPYRDREILMQVDVATGFDAAINCPGGRKGTDYNGVQITTPEPTPKVYDDGVARVRVLCKEGNVTGVDGSCEGSLKLEAEGVLLGTSDNFKLVEKASTNVQVKLGAQGAAMLTQRGTISAMATATTKDNYGAERTDSASVNLVSARPAVGVGGFVGLTAKPQSLTYKKSRKLKMKATCPAGTTGNCTGTVTATSRKKIGKKKVKMIGGRYSIAPGKTASFSVTLTAAGAKALKKAKRVDTTAVISSKDGAGKKATQKIKLTFKYSR